MRGPYPALGALATLPLKLLRHRRASALTFVLIYSLGLGVFLWVDGMWRRVEGDLQARARDLLEADVQIETRRPMTVAESARIEAVLPAGTRRAEAWGFVSMVATPQGQSRLVQVKAVDAGYPLYGRFSFEAGTLRDLADWGPYEVLAPPGLLAGLGLKVGDSLQLGERRFSIRAAYTDRPGGGFDLWELSGRIYMHLDEVAETGLDRKGSRIFRYRFFGLPAGVDDKAVKKALALPLDDPEWHVRSAGDHDSDLGRILVNVGAFIKILALGAYWLAAIGAGFFFARHLEAERVQAALLRTLGLTPWRVAALYAGQCLALSALAALVGLALAWTLSAAAAPWLLATYGVTLPAGLPAKTWLLGVLLPGFTGLLFASGHVWQIGRTSPATLLRAVDPPGLPWFAKVLLLSTQGLWILVFARLISRSWTLASASLGILITASLLLAAFGGGLATLLWKFRARLGYADRVILGAVRLRASRALTAFFALGFTAFAIALLPLLRQTLAEEMASPKGHRLPSLFLFDVQEEQEPGLTALLERLHAPVQSLSAMVRARLVAVNGKTFKRDDNEALTLEAKAKARMRNRGFNLSWRDALSQSETVVAGRFWPSGSHATTAMPEISVEQGFARKLDVVLGDTLLFDVQGVEIAGRITSLRRVRWNSFQPNFFVLFQPGALEEAPKTFLGTVGVAQARAGQVRDSVVRAYPNVSVMEVSEALARLDNLMGRLQHMVSLLSIGYLAIGFCILLTVLEGSVRDGRRSLLLLCALGATRRRLAWAFARHYVAFGLAATAGGLVLAVIAAYLVHAWVWDIAFTPPWRDLALGLAAGWVVGGIAGLWAALRSRGGSLKTLLSASRGE